LKAIYMHILYKILLVQVYQIITFSWHKTQQCSQWVKYLKKKKKKKKNPTAYQILKKIKKKKKKKKHTNGSSQWHDYMSLSQYNVHVP